MVLHFLPSSIIGILFNWISAHDITRLYICGNGFLNARMSCTSGVESFCLELGPVFAPRYPRFVNSFTNLRTLSVAFDFVFNDMPMSPPLNCSQLPPSLQTLRLGSGITASFQSSHPLTLSSYFPTSLTDLELQFHLHAHSTGAHLLNILPPHLTRLCAPFWNFHHEQLSQLPSSLLDLEVGAIYNASESTSFPPDLRRLSFTYHPPFGFLESLPLTLTDLVLIPDQGNDVQFPKSLTLPSQLLRFESHWDLSLGPLPPLLQYLKLHGGGGSRRYSKPPMMVDCDVLSTLPRSLTHLEFENSNFDDDTGQLEAFVMALPPGLKFFTHPRSRKWTPKILQLLPIEIHTMLVIHYQRGSSSIWPNQDHITRLDFGLLVDSDPNFVYPPNLLTLSFRRNPIERFYSGIETCAHLMTLTLNQCSLTELPPLPSSLTRLELHSCYSYFIGRPIPLPPHLKNLLIKESVYGTQFPTEWFPLFPPSLVSLRIDLGDPFTVEDRGSTCGIQPLALRSMKHLRSLTKLSLSPLQPFSDELLSDLPKGLRKLKIASSRMESADATRRVDTYLPAGVVKVSLPTNHLFAITHATNTPTFQRLYTR